MARFKRLTWDDLSNFTREELLPRLEAEQEYWARKQARGFSAADQEARKTFGQIVAAVIEPSRVVDAMAETTAWLKGERSTGPSYWSEKPVRDQPR